MASEIAWVALLSCGHSIGSKPPRMADPDPPPDSVMAQRAMAAGYPMARAAQPPEPDFVVPPDPDQFVYCTECNEARWLINLIENKDEPLPQLDKRRAGTRW